MTTLTLRTPEGRTIAVLALDFSESSANGEERYAYANGDLPGGNLYLYVDGAEWGSLFLVEKNGQLEVSLGQYDSHGTEDWVARNPLTHAVHALPPFEAIAAAHHPYDWFTPHVFPSCSCGFAPHDNGRLNAHWRDAGIGWSDNHGQLVSHPVGGA